jgi:oligoribonuclease NrnB/cAMP/cGMP phosphodiesterase (DHH superfamily)
VVHIFYHKNCGDGLAAAYVARLRFVDAPEDDREVRFSAIDYQSSLPEDIGVDEYCVFVDFCPEPDQVEYLHSIDCKVKVIDHHEGVLEQLQAMQAQAHERQAYFSFVYDIEQSGASLCWQHWFPGVPIPPYISYVRDIDLYNFFLRQSRKIKHAMYATVRGLSFIEQMALLDCWAKLTNEEFVSILGSRGVPIWAEICRNVDALTQPEMVGRALIGGHRVPFVFASRHISEVGEALYNRYPNEPFVAIASPMEDGRTQWNLRSNKYAQKPFYCFPIAQMYGGNGHRHAAGFKTSPSTEGVQYTLKTELSDTDRINNLLKGSGK